MADYSLSESFVGGDDHDSMWGKSVHWVEGWVGSKPLAQFLVGLVIVLVLWQLYMWWVGEHLATGSASIPWMQRDGLGERMAGGRDQSAIAQQIQAGGAQGQIAFNPSAAGGVPGSLGWAVLNNPDFNCAGRQMSPDDAWAWMNSAAHESFASGGDKPRSDADLTRIMSGHS